MLPLAILAALLCAPAPAAQPRLDNLPPLPEAPAAEGPVLALAEALALARSQSPDLEVLRERVNQAQIQVSRAWDAIKPTLTGNLAYTRNSQQSVTFSPGAPPVQLIDNDHTANLTLAATLFNGRVFPALATAKQQVEVARLTASQLRRELLLNVAAAYLTGVGLKRLSTVQLRQSKTTREHAAQAQARYEAGTLQRSAALRARIDVLRADEEARRAQVQYAQAKSQVAQLLDRRDTAFELVEPAEPSPELQGTFNELFQRALLERPELAAAKINEQIAARLKDDAWAQFLPSLTANAALRYDRYPFSIDQHTTWAITLALSIPLYDGGLRYEALRDAASKTREAKAQTRSQASKVADEVRRAQLDLAAARALAVEAEQQVELARETESLVRAQFEAGTASQVEVSDAETALAQSEATSVQERLNVQLSGLRLARAVGAFDP